MKSLTEGIERFEIKVKRLIRRREMGFPNDFFFCGLIKFELGYKYSFILEKDTI